MGHSILGAVVFVAVVAGASSLERRVLGRRLIRRVQRRVDEGGRRPWWAWGPGKFIDTAGRKAFRYGAVAIALALVVVSRASAGTAGWVLLVAAVAVVGGLLTVMTRWSKRDGAAAATRADPPHDSFPRGG